MADDVSIELWMDRRRLAALERVMRESGTDTQTVMQARFDALYRQYVPMQERTDINNTLRASASPPSVSRRNSGASRRSMWTEHGAEKYFTTDDGLELLDARRRRFALI